MEAEHVRPKQMKSRACLRKQQNKFRTPRKNAAGGVIHFFSECVDNPLHVKTFLCLFWEEKMHSFLPCAETLSVVMLDLGGPAPSTKTSVTSGCRNPKARCSSFRRFVLIIVSRCFAIGIFTRSNRSRRTQQFFS